MDRFIIEGGVRLSGRLAIKGAKNAALPLMAAALLTDQPLLLTDVPDLADIDSMTRLLAELGCRVDRTRRPGPTSTGGTMRLLAEDESSSHARYDIVRTMRASICVLGPLLARRGYARVSMPGGCAIGDRPVDLHLRGMEALGAEISLDSGDITARAPGRKPDGTGGRLKGATIFLGGPFGSTVLGTANVMSAATLAEGTTVIESAACEPEVVDLANLLNAMGARIEGAGSPRITIHGVEALSGTSHRVIPDRIEAGTYMLAAAITNGDLLLDNCPLDALMAVTDTLARVGVNVAIEPVSLVAPLSERCVGESGRSMPGLGSESRATTPLPGLVKPESEGPDPLRRICRITCSRVLRPVEVTTQPHPGFPTDLQAQLMALLCIGEGNSIITERIYPERFLHVAELSRMGAKIFRQGPTAVVSGVRKLVGAPVMASDLRASAGLVLAGLAAEGMTTVNRVYHLDRGYEHMEESLRLVGARIERSPEPAPSFTPAPVSGSHQTVEHKA